MIIEVNNHPIQIGSIAAMFGHPLRSLVAAALAVDRADETLKPLDIVMAGSAAAAHPSIGEYGQKSFQNLGTVSFTVAA